MEQQYKYKLAISILTRNREAFVEEILERLSMALYDRNIGLYLLDGSDANELGEIIHNYRKHGFDNIHYQYYCPAEYGGDSIFQRFHDGGVAVDAEYVWRCSDKFVPSKEGLDRVLEQLDKNYDIIVYNVLYRNDEKTKEYVDRVEFFKECAPKLQMLSAAVLGRRIIDRYTKENLYKIAGSRKYSEIELVFRTISEIKDFKGMMLCFTDSKKPMRLQLVTSKDAISEHVKMASTFDCFIDRMCNTINELPEMYNKEKKYVMKNFSCSTWFSLEGFLKLRWNKGYYFKQCFEYIDKWKFVTDIPIIIIIGISVLPPSVARFLYKRVCRVKKIMNKQHF